VRHKHRGVLSQESALLDYRNLNGKIMFAGRNFSLLLLNSTLYTTAL